MNNPINMDEVLKMFEAVMECDESDIMSTDIGDQEQTDTSFSIFNTSDDDDILDELNRIYTPVMITQKLEGDLAPQILEACSEANVLVEQNIMKFDNESRLAQLVSLCSLLLARKHNTSEYQMFVKAAKIKKAMKLRMQNQEHAKAVILARKYLQRISNNSTSSVARDAANDLHQ